MTQDAGFLQAVIDRTVDKLVVIIKRSIVKAGPLGQKVTNEEQMAQWRALQPIEEHLAEFSALVAQYGAENVNLYVKTMKAREAQSLAKRTPVAGGV